MKLLIRAYKAYERYKKRYQGDTKGLIKEFKDHIVRYLTIKFPKLSHPIRSIFVEIKLFFVKQKNAKMFSEGLDRFKGFRPQNDYQFHEKFTTILPIYGQIPLVRHLANSIRQDVEAGMNLIVIDDRKDEFSSKRIHEIFSNWPNTKIIKNKSNLGYLRSVNTAYTQVKTRFCILLNSDIEVPPNWIPRMARALSNKDTALATALATNSGANLTIDLPKHRNWLEVDQFLNSFDPKYPDACTAIGYLLGINTELIEPGPLFDESFKDGYGEDSDLHYRVVGTGYKSVIVDNLLVRHSSGASYSTKENIQKIREINTRVFNKKWGQKHLREEMRWSIKNPLAVVRAYVEYLNKKTQIAAEHCIIVPTLAKTSGGIIVAIELYDELVRNNSKTRILQEHEYSKKIKKQMFSKMTRTITVTSTSTYEIALDVKRSFNTKIANFVQGPELFFENGHHSDNFIDMVKKAHVNICISEYLRELTVNLGSKNSINCHFGPETDSFYPPENPKRTKTVVIGSRVNVDKGSQFLIPFISFLNREGWEIVSFGPIHTSILSDKRIRNLGHIDPESIRHLFETSSYLLDLSLFEGLGLVPCEALATGCTPVVTLKGGLESILDSSSEVKWLSSIHAQDEELKELFVYPRQSTRNKSSIFEGDNRKIGIELATKAILGLEKVKNRNQ